MGVVVNLRRCVCGGKAAIEPEYHERIDENGNIYEHESWYCHCVKCEVSTGLCSCEESAADAWDEGHVYGTPGRKRGKNKR